MSAPAEQAIEDPGAALDQTAAAIFEGHKGAVRLKPLLERFDAQVGSILEDDACRETLLAMRLDWALCDAAIEGGRGPGDTWMRRAAAGEIEGVCVDPRLQTTYAGLFEVWPGRRPFVRDRLRGLSVGLAEDIEVPWSLDGDRSIVRSPAALWELRVVLARDGARLCRPPLPYPLELLPWLSELGIERFGAGTHALTLVKLRRRWLQFSRARRADPMSIFSLERRG